MKFRRKYIKTIKKNISERNFSWLLKQLLNAMSILLSVKTKKCFNYPILCGLVVTYRCNMKCLFCQLPRRSTNPEFNEDEFKSMILQFHDLGGTAIGFTGGEPLLRKDIFGLIKFAKNKKMATQLTTNGILLNEDTSVQLIDSGLDDLGISLESHKPLVHDEIRGINNCWQKVIEGIKIFLKVKDRMHAGAKITISTVLNEKNIDDVKDFIDFCHNIGIDNISFGMVQEEFAKGNIRIEDKEKYSKVIEMLIDYVKEGYMVDNSIEYLKEMCDGFSKNNECWAGFQSLYVDCYGDIFPCYYYIEKNWCINNIKNGSLKELWKSKDYGLLRKKLLTCKNCSFVCHKELNTLFNMCKKIMK